MREIKFRGQRVDTKEWVYGYLIQCGITGKSYIFSSGNDANESQKVGEDGCLRLVTFEIIPKTVGQYTGLKDKNGKKIYECDILDLKYFLTKNKGIVKFGKYKQCDMSSEYECGNQGFYIDVTNDKYDTYRHDIYFYAHKSEVIGNIYENPKLL